MQTDDIEKRLWHSIADETRKGTTPIVVSPDDLYYILRALKTWREIAHRLGDITAATAEDLLMKKSTPKCERKRQLSIVETTLACFAHETADPISYPVVWRKDIVERFTHILGSPAAK